MPKSVNALLAALLIFSLATQAQQKDYVQYVNTLQGTNSNWGLSYGNTYPTIAVPFRVHSWSPQTGKYGSYKQEVHEIKEMVIAKMGQTPMATSPCSTRPASTITAASPGNPGNGPAR